MSEETEFWSKLAAAIGTVCLIIGIFIGRTSAIDEIRNEAVKSGVARWVSNNDGSVKFQFLRGTENEKLVND